MNDRAAEGASKTAPADGERRAIRNLSAQYLVAAAITYDALLAGELEWIRLVDPDADRVDDLLIGRPGHIDAYQVKWSQWKGNISFKNLVDPTTVSGKPYPSAFNLLAHGWRALKGVYPTRHVRQPYPCAERWSGPATPRCSSEPRSASGSHVGWPPTRCGRRGISDGAKSPWD